jgi:hypothetical protein
MSKDKILKIEDNKLKIEINLDSEDEKNDHTKYLDDSIAAVEMKE